MQLCSEIGMLFQGSALFDSLTITENVLFPMQMFSEKAKKSNKTEPVFASRGLKVFIMYSICILRN